MTQEISQNTHLDHDLVDVEGPAFVIAADGITLDLGGHRISAKPRSRIDAPGILLRGVSNVTVRNGTVEEFAAGVAIEGGGSNRIENLTVQDNVGDFDGDYGDGIVIVESSENEIVDNVVRSNGPFSGISLGRNSQRNEIRDNIVVDNNMSQLEDTEPARQTMGIRIEGPAANHNRIIGNTVTGSGADGIVVLATCDNPDADPPCVGTPPNENNEIAHNNASRNGASGRGSGIRIFNMPLPVSPAGNLIHDNVADENAWYGIAIDGPQRRSVSNEAARNRAHGNGEYDGSDGCVLPPCAANLWIDNDFGTVNQPCVSKTARTP